MERLVDRLVFLYRKAFSIKEVNTCEYRMQPRDQFTRREDYPCAKVALESGLKIPLVYSQISQVPRSTLPAFN